MEIIWENEEEIALSLAKRIKEIRRRKGISQERLAELSGVSFGSIKRFETSGQISFIHLIKIAKSLNCANEIKLLFMEA